METGPMEGVGVVQDEAQAKQGDQLGLGGTVRRMLDKGRQFRDKSEKDGKRLTRSAREAAKDYEKKRKEEIKEEKRRQKDL